MKNFNEFVSFVVDSIVEIPLETCRKVFIYHEPVDQHSVLLEAPGANHRVLKDVSNKSVEVGRAPPLVPRLIHKAVYAFAVVYVRERLLNLHVLPQLLHPKYVAKSA